MGKANKVKYELINANELVDLIQVLKDVADNKFYALLNQKDRFARFGESFVELFRLISFSSVKHLLLANDTPTVGIVVITSEGSFLGDLNTKVIRMALAEKGKYPNSVLIVVGKKGVLKLGKSTEVIKVFEDIDQVGLYNMATRIKDYLIEQLMTSRLGKIIAIYPWPKNLNIIKPRIARLLPADELLSKQVEFADIVESIIQESQPEAIIGYLIDLWLSTKIYELLFDTSIAAAAAQSQQLENSIKKMQKERVAVRLKYRKAKKGDIDKSLREVFTARMMMQRVKK